jgi:hypothetical protein
MRKSPIVLLVVLLLCSWSVMSADVIWNIHFSPGRHCAMRNGEYVNISFDYTISTAGGVRIFPRPFTNGALTPSYGASGSDVYTGSGTGTAYFTITSGEVVVDNVRFEVLNADQSQTILVFYVPVDFHYGADGIYNIQVSPPWTSLEFGRTVNISFDYSVSTSGGIRIFPRPFTNGALTPNYGASGSGVYTGGGSETGAFFTITSGNARVDHIRFQLTDANQTQILKEFFVPVDFNYAGHSITNIVITPPSPNGLLNGENVDITFDYYTSEPSGVRIFARPFTDGNLTPNYGAHGSSVYPTGYGAGTGWFTISSGMANVDSIRFEMLDAAQTTVLLEYFVPVNLYYSTAKITDIVFRPESPAYFTNSEHDTAAFAYVHSNSGGALAWAAPKTNGTLTPYYSFQGSTVVPVGSGNLERRFTISAGSVKVDAAWLLMMNVGQSETYVDWDIPVDFYFGSQPLTGIVDAPEQPSTFALGQNYPNPFNPRTTIRYELPVSSNVRLSVYDLLGRELLVLEDGWKEAGAHEVMLDGSALSSGIYLYRLQAGETVATKKLVILK